VSVGRLAFLVFLIASTASLSGCLARRRLITRHGALPSRALMTATKDDLVNRMRRLNDNVRSFSATVDMTPAIGSVYKGEITEYKDVRAYVLFRRPAEIRIIGLYPVVRSKAFDMVSTGNEFRIYIPAKNRFVEGTNDAPANSANKLENLRPAAFLEAMLIPPPDPGEQTVLEDATDENDALYILHFLGKDDAGNPIISRNVWFDRQTLRIVRQKSFSKTGITVSDTRYHDWKVYDNVAFPSGIDINRPVDGYGVVMTVTQMEANKTLSQDKFVLPQPEGTQLQVIGQKPAPVAAAPRP
jgi:outer membrane lipoprotein-sorting protein